jgi:uncharacterized protein with GYD domain
MPQYVSLMKFTAQGISTIKSSPDRVKSARTAIEAAGGQMISYHVTLGQYDGIAITEFPNDEAAATLLLAIGSQGNITSETMRAFTEDEYAALVANL